MKTKIIPITFILFFYLVIFEGYTDANTLFLGNIESVYPDGAINALKNPALVSAQKEKSSLGLLLNYRVYDQVNSDLNLGILTDEKTETEIEKDITGGTSIVFTKKFNKQGFGIGLSNSDSYIYSYKEEKTRFSGTTAASQVYSVNTEEKVKNINPKISFNYGLQLGENSFFGLKLTGIYSRTDTESETTEIVKAGTVTVSTVNKNHDEIKSIISGELCFGFYFNEKGSQLGFMAKSGKLSFVKSDIDYYNDELTEPEGENSYSYYKQYNEGVSLLAGGYTRLLPFLGIALEGGFQLPAYYNEKSFDDKTFESKETSVANKSVILIKGGLDFILSPRLRVDIGGNLFFATISADGENTSYGNSDYRGFNCMAGLDYYSQGGIRFMAGTVVSRFAGTGKSQIDDGAGSVIMMDMKNILLSINAYFGIMYLF